MQYPVPQFIDEEGKMVYFLTYRQFFELVGGGAVIIALYWIIPWFGVTIALSILVAIITLALAFGKVGHQGLPAFFMGMIGFTLRSKTYTWKKVEDTAKDPTKKAPVVKPVEAKATIAPLSAGPSKLAQIQKTIDTKK